MIQFRTNKQTFKYIRYMYFQTKVIHPPPPILFTAIPPPPLQLDPLHPKTQPMPKGK